MVEPPRQPATHAGLRRPRPVRAGLGEGGAVDFTSIRETLDAQNYQGAYTVELEGIGGEPEPGLEERVNRLRKSYEWLKTCGY